MCKATWREKKHPTNSPVSHRWCKTINSVTYPLTIITKATKHQRDENDCGKKHRAVLLLI